MSLITMTFDIMKCFDIKLRSHFHYPYSKYKLMVRMHPCYKEIQVMLTVKGFPITVL